MLTILILSLIYLQWKIQDAHLDLNLVKIMLQELQMDQIHQVDSVHVWGRIMGHVTTMTEILHVVI